MDSKHNKLSFLFLPRAIIEEILLRLPVKSLLRFRCVSKSWRCLIDSDRFIKNHLQTSSKNASFAHHRLLLLLSNEESVSDEEGEESESQSVRIVGCCNGLVCCWSNFGNLERGYFVLWNPATRIFRYLPELDLKIEGWLWSIACCGFDWDESSGAHKVFVILYCGWDRMVKLYSSKTNSWKPVIEFIDFEFKYNFPEFVGGKLHWLRMNTNNDIVTFDMRSEEFGVMELPHESVKSLRVNEGCLSAICGNMIPQNGVWPMKYTDVWSMKEGSWVKAADIVLYKPWVKAANVVFYDRRKILRSALLGAGHDAEIWLLRGRTFELDDPAQDDELRNQKIEAFDHNMTNELYFHYVESLVSPIPNKRSNCA